MLNAHGKSLKYVEYCACAIIVVIKWAQLNVEYHNMATQISAMMRATISKISASISMKGPLNDDNLHAWKGER